MLGAALGLPYSARTRLRPQPVTFNGNRPTTTASDRSKNASCINWIARSYDPKTSRLQSLDIDYQVCLREPITHNRPLTLNRPPLWGLWG